MRIVTGAVHHLRLTVTDVERAHQFYTTLLDFHEVVKLPSAVVLSNGRVWLGLGSAPDPARATAGARFDENQVGLDHVSFAVATRGDLDQAMEMLDKHGVPHGPITDLGPTLGIYILSFRDPDHIQLELTAPHGLPV